MKEIKKAYEAISIPVGLESRLEEKLEASLGMPLREKRIVLKPKATVWKPLLPAAAVLVLLIVGLTAIGMSHKSQQQTVQPLPAANPEAEVEIETGEDAKNDLSLYSQVLTKYRTALDTTRDWDVWTEQGLCNRFITAFVYGNHPVQICFALEDLDGDGTPELLVGPPKNEVSGDTGHMETIYDAYCLRDGEPMQIFCAASQQEWRYLGEGKLLQIVNEQTASPSYLLWQFVSPQEQEPVDPHALSAIDAAGYAEALRFLDGISRVNDPDTGTETWRKVGGVQNAELGRILYDLTDSVVVLFDETEISDKEAKTWIKAHSDYVTLDVCRLEEGERLLPTPQPETPPEGLTEKQYQELRLFLQEIVSRDEAFVLDDFTASDSGSVVTLLEQVGILARERGLVPSQMRGLLLGRLNLDGASAEAYAALMGELYRLNPKDFLQAWHEAGEPAELMQEITGTLDPAESKRWLREQWEAASMAEPPDPACFGTVTADDAQELLVIIDRARELELLGKDETVAFDPEALFDESAEIEYYLDDTILVICWKEIIEGNTCSFAEVKLADPEQLRRYDPAAAGEEPTWSTCTELHRSTNAVLSLNGDYSCGHDLGIVVSEGELTRFSTEPYTGAYQRYNCLETCLVDEQGDFHFTELGKEYSKEELQQYLKENKIRFSLSFGPVLVRDGKVRQCDWYPLGEIDQGYSRAGIGQVDRLHYLYMSVNHSPEAEARWTVNQFARHFGEKAVQNAYCLDGGQTAEIVFRDRPYNAIDYGVERPVIDDLYFVTARSGDWED